MDLEKLEKAIELKKKLDFVKEANKDLDETVIFIGTQKRLDVFMDIHERLKEVMQDEMKQIEQEILTEINNF